MNYLTLASMIRNEEHYVQEWLTFHHVQGFEHFVIVLHKCDDKTEERIRALPFADNINIHKVVSDTPQAQMSVFVWIAEHYGSTTEWMMFCDCDEFSFGTDTDDFREVLEKYEDYGGLFVNWMEYGHNHHISRPKDLCIEAYTKRADNNLWSNKSGKSIIKPRELVHPYAPDSQNDSLRYSFLSPHLFKTSKPTVHTDFTPVSYRYFWMAEHICHDTARCNHYRIRSQEDWIEKCRRGNGNDAKTNHGNTLDEWSRADYHHITDRSAMRFVKPVKEILGK